MLPSFQISVRSLLIALVGIVFLVGAATVHAADTKKPAASTKKKAPAKKAPVKEAEPEKPIWAYRPHYVFSGETLFLDNDQDNGEWRLRGSETDIIADPIGFEIELSDGTKITNAQMKPLKSDRGPKVDPKIGAGIVYDNEFQAYNGLKVTQRIMKYMEKPFLTVRMVLENTTDKPVQVTRIAPIVVGPGAMTGFAADVTVHSHNVVARGGFAVRETAHPPVMTRLHDPARRGCILFGMLPTGRGDAASEFKHDGTGWVGAAGESFSPPLTVAPGATTEGDAVCIGFTSSTVESNDTFYAWGLSTGLRKATILDGPRSWATTKPGGSFSDLQDAASFWSKRGVKHALARVGTKGNFSQMASTMKKSGMGLGMEIDPLDADDQNGGWVITGADGRRWLDPTSPEAVAWLTKRVTTLKKSDCAFIVIADTQCPAEVLAKIGLPREESVQRAADAIEAAAGKMHLYGAPGTPMPADNDYLTRATTELFALVQYGVYPPVMELALNGDAKEQLALAMTTWAWPIALVGKP